MIVASSNDACGPPHPLAAEIAPQARMKEGLPTRSWMVVPELHLPRKPGREQDVP
jgi:hypothetical protein